MCMAHYGSSWRYASAQMTRWGYASVHKLWNSILQMISSRTRSQQFLINHVCNKYSTVCIHILAANFIVHVNLQWLHESSIVTPEVLINMYLNCITYITYICICIFLTFFQLHSIAIHCVRGVDQRPKVKPLEPGEVRGRKRKKSLGAPRCVVCVPKLFGYMGAKAWWSHKSALHCDGSIVRSRRVSSPRAGGASILTRAGSSLGRAAR